MLLLADMSPTLLESSTSPRGLLMPSLRPRLMLTMELTDILDLAMLVPMAPMVPMVLAMDMVDMLLPMPTTERGLLMPSLRPRLMLTMELTDILVLAMLVAMLDMLLPMPMVPTTERGPLMLSPRLMPTMEFTAMVLAMDTAIPVPTAMVPTPTPMVLMLTASKCHRLQFNCLTYCEPK